MLDIIRVIKAKPKDHEPEPHIPLTTPWGEALDAEHVLEDHPRPEFARSSYASLNGRWEYAFVTETAAATAWANAEPPAAFDGQIVVPFSPEASLSGVGRQLQPDELLWYRRSLEVGEALGEKRLLLHFEAVDWACSVWVNGALAGTHVGGYLPFCCDVSELVHEGANELLVCVHDPSETGGQLRGKQSRESGNIWYTAQSGIWQSVWTEVVPAAHVSALVVEGRVGAGSGAGVGAAAAAVRVEARLSYGGEDLRVTVRDAAGMAAGETSIAVPAGTSVDCALEVPVAEPHLWSPDDPHLYTVEIAYGDDRVSSYAGLRHVIVAPDEKGVQRVMLNGQPILLKGVLDQGYWPDGLLTAPADEAFVYDIEQMRRAGFNTLRKHIKIEAGRWYYLCDKLGMLVWQDMVSGGGPYDSWKLSYRPTLFRNTWWRYPDSNAAHYADFGADNADYRHEWEETCLAAVRLLRGHPSVIGWTLFNEGWGQFDAARMCAAVRKADPTRPIDAVSGWYDQGCGNLHSVHNYFRTMAVWRDRAGHRTGRKRAFVISECGGLSHRVDGHSTQQHTYGYDVFESRAEWQGAVHGLLEQIEALWDQGLAGYVYTQVSDIEEEVNGILTYDRRVNKLDAGA